MTAMQSRFLQRIVETFMARTNLGRFGGRVLLHDLADNPITILESLVPVELQPSAYVRARLIHGANMAFRRGALVEVGGFGQRIGSGTPFCFEDIDIAALVNGAGWHRSYAQEPTPRHHHGRQSEREFSELKGFHDLGRGALYTKMTLAGEWPYLKYWTYLMRQEPLSTSDREVRGGLRYVWSAKPRASMKSASHCLG